MSSLVERLLARPEPLCHQAARAILEDQRAQLHTCMICKKHKPRSVRVVTAQYRLPSETGTDPIRNREVCMQERMLRICRSCENRNSFGRGHAEYGNGFYLHAITKET